MSVSNINNTTPNQVPWANLSCNSLNCNSLSVQNPVVGSFPTTSETLSIALAVNSTTPGITFNYTINPFPATFSAGTGPSLKINENGLYLVSVKLLDIAMSNTANSYGNITAVFKVDPGNGTYAEIAEQTQTIADNTTLVNYAFTQLVDVTAPNTNVQVLFRRQNAALANGSVIVPVNGSGIKIIKLA